MIQVEASPYFLPVDCSPLIYKVPPPEGGPSKGTDHIIRTNALTISENITLDASENGMTAGPVTIASSYTVTVTSGSTWTIV